MGDWIGYRIYDKNTSEAQPTDAVSREAVIRLVEQYPNIIGNRCSGLISDIKHLPSVTPINEDISEAYIKGYDYGVKDWFKSKTQPCEDCISILNRIMEYTYGMLTAEKIGLQHLIKSMIDEMSEGR